MPISEDEYDFRQGQEAQTTMSKAELRKTHKPIMEKRRRARINHSLNEIKSLILEAMKKDPARHSKLEKADILEMAVKHLQNVQRQQLALAMATDPSVLRKFKSGFNDCANEVGKYISQIEGVDQSMQQRVMGHLNKCINGIEQIAQINFPGFANLPFFGNFTPPASSTSAASPSVGDQNNNPTVHRLQLIPSRLPTGEFALLLPNSSNFPYFPLSSVPSQLNQTDSPNAQNPQNHRPSAFAKVTPSSQGLTEVKPLSPPQSPTNQSDVNLLNKNYQRSTSPQGFRPVNPQRNQQNLLASTSNDLHQVPQVSSTQTEVKQIKYPIHTYQERDKKLPSPKKFVEPLCIITNQTERFKQAQTKDESVTFEENYPRGVKRTFTEHQQGLLTVAYKDFSQPSPKIPKVLHEPNPSVSRNIFKGSEEKPSTSKSSDEGNSDMWRPW